MTKQRISINRRGVTNEDPQPEYEPKRKGSQEICRRRFGIICTMRCSFMRGHSQST